MTLYLEGWEMYWEISAGYKFLLRVTDDADQEKKTIIKETTIQT